MVNAVTSSWTAQRRHPRRAGKTNPSAPRTSRCVVCPTQHGVKHSSAPMSRLTRTRVCLSMTNSGYYGDLTMALPGGGCVKASPFGSPSTGGVNCHDIPNVDEVSCKESKCFVHTCKSGFAVSVCNDECIANPHAKSTRDLSVPGTGPCERG